MRPAGVGQSQHAGHFIKRFTRRVINRPPKVLSAKGIFVAIQMGMPATNDKPNARKDWLLGR